MVTWLVRLPIDSLSPRCSSLGKGKGSDEEAGRDGNRQTDRQVRVEEREATWGETGRGVSGQAAASSAVGGLSTRFPWALRDKVPRPLTQLEAKNCLPLSLVENNPPVTRNEDAPRVCTCFI